MRTLVTGGHGFVGSHLVDLLLARGDRVRCLHRRPRLPATLEGKDVEIAHGDIRDPQVVASAVRGVDEVFHLAALTRSRTRAEMLGTNTGGTVVLLDAAARACLPGRFVLCSSLAAVGPAPEGVPLDESAPCRPVTWYGESKRLAEIAALRWRDRLAVTVIRPPAVYGPRDRDFLPVFQAARRGFLPLLGTRPRRYHFVYAPDLAEGMLVAARSVATAGGTYFLAHPEILTAEEFAGHVARAVGGRPRRLRIPDALLSLVADLGELAGQVTGRTPLINRQRMRELEGRAYVCSAEALARDADWRARTGAVQGTALTAAWYREEAWL